MAFKDIINEDINRVFFNDEEFAETHKWNSQDIVAVIADDELMSKFGSEFEFLEKGSHLIKSPSSFFTKKPRVGSAINFDGNLYTIDEVHDEAGVYSIYLNATRV